MTSDICTKTEALKCDWAHVIVVLVKKLYWLSKISNPDWLGLTNDDLANKYFTE